MSTEAQEVSSEVVSPSTESQTSNNDNVSQENDVDAFETNQQARERYRSEPGYSPVDLSDLPEDKQKVLQDRFGYYHRQTKELEKKNEHLHREFTQWQQHTAKQIEELTSGVGSIVDHMETANHVSIEQQLQSDMHSAWEAGNFAEYNKLQKELISHEVKKATKPKETPKNQTQQQAHAGYSSTSDIANEALQAAEIGPEEAQLVDAWQSERDAQGNLVRPWAWNPEGGVPKPNSPMDRALREFASLELSPAFANLSFQKKLEEVDRRMGVKKMNGNQTVMGGSLTRPAKTSNLSISQREEILAIKTKFGGPKAKSDADHVKAWRENKMKQQKRSR